jgi:DNA-binding MarR family transcriptional regulator
MTSSNLDHEAAEFETLSLRLSWSMRRRLQQALEAYNLTLPQYMALNCLSRCEQNCSMSELAEATHQLGATMTGIIDRLEERGLVARERDRSDRRALRVGLSPEGRKLMAQIGEHKRSMMRALMGALTAEERALLITAANRILSVIEAPAPVEEPLVGD